MNPNKYDRFSYFIEDLIKELNTTNVGLAKHLGLSHAYVSQWRNNKKIPGEEVFIKLSEVYKLDLDSCLRLRERSIKEREKEKSNVEEKENLGEQQVVSVAEELNPLQQEIDQIFDDNSNPELLNLIGTLKNLSDDMQQELVPDIREIIESRIFNMIQKYSYRDVKKVITETFDTWKKSVDGPGYKKEGKDNFSKELEGFLELSNTSLFFSLVSDEQLLQMKTRYQDRHLIQDLLKLISGIKVTEFTNGHLGKAYKNIPLYNVYFYNPAPLVLEMKPVFMSHNIQLNKVTFEECSIEPYFKTI